MSTLPDPASAVFQTLSRPRARSDLPATAIGAVPEERWSIGCSSGEASRHAVRGISSSTVSIGPQDCGSEPVNDNGTLYGIN